MNIKTIITSTIATVLTTTLTACYPAHAEGTAGLCPAVKNVGINNIGNAKLEILVPAITGSMNVCVTCREDKNMSSPHVLVYAQNVVGGTTVKLNLTPNRCTIQYNMGKTKTIRIEENETKTVKLD